MRDRGGSVARRTRISGRLARRVSGRWASHFVGVWVALGLLAGCQGNRCQRLCEAFYQMDLRCALFAAHDQYHPLRCEAGVSDPQQLRQQADYAIRRCEQDFINPSCEEQAMCCKVVCYESLLDDYDAVVDTREQDYERMRDLCRKYRQLVADGDAPWCQGLRASCEDDIHAADGPCASGA